MPKIKLQNGYTLNYKDVGNGFPIIIVHGTLAHLMNFLNLYI